MASFDLQGESNSLSEKQIKFVCDVLEKNDFQGSKVTITTPGKAGDNYASNVKSIIAERKDGEILKMIVKVAPTSDFLRAAMNVDVLFGNEFFMYDKVLPKFRQLQIEADIPEEDRLKFPICYGIFDEVLHEIILLEDLRERDYVMKDRFKCLTDEEVRVILGTFAKFHSLSFALKRKYFATYKEFSSKLKDFFTTEEMTDNMKNNFKLVEENIISVFDVEKYKDKIKNGFSNIADEAHKLRRCDAGSKYAVIIHGDPWTNNFLFKQHNINGIPEECMLIDYQLSSERCPVSDFLYLIFSCTDYDTRSKHYGDWIDEYHEKLDKYLSHYGIKANYVYSKEKMLADLKRYSKFFLGWSMVLSNVLCMDIENAAKFKDAMDSSDDLEEIMESMKNTKIDSKTQVLLKTRVQGIIDSFYELGYCS